MAAAGEADVSAVHEARDGVELLDEPAPVGLGQLDDRLRVVRAGDDLDGVRGRHVGIGAPVGKPERDRRDPAQVPRGGAAVSAAGQLVAVEGVEVDGHGVIP